MDLDNPGWGEVERFGEDVSSGHASPLSAAKPTRSHLYQTSDVLSFVPNPREMFLEP